MQSGLVPILVGITGHRNLRPEDLPALEKAVRGVFQEMLNRCPETPHMLLTPLAEGADRLAARVALGLGLKLQVILPMPTALYVTDFHSDDSRREFQILLDKAVSIIEIPLPGGFAAEDVERPGAARDRQYEMMGVFIARHSQILVAMWDGAVNDKRGGTAHIVKHRLGMANDESLLHPPDPVHSGPVYQIVTPRSDQPAPTQAFSLIKRFPDGIGHDLVAEEVFHRIHRAINSFNRDVVRFATPLAHQRELSKQYLLPEAETKQLSSALQFTRECFASADTLAGYFQKSTLRHLAWLFLLVFLAVLVFEVFLHVLHEEALGMLLYPAALAAAYMVYLQARWHDVQNKYQDYRALAEGLRVQFFWRLAGLTIPVDSNYLRRQRSELHWIRHSIRVCWSLQGGEIESACGPQSDAQRQERLTLVVKHWVEDQQSFFVRAAHREEHKNHRIESTIKWGVWLGLILALLAGGVLTFPNPIGETMHHWFKDIGWLEGLIVVVTGVPLFGAALLHAYGAKLAVAEHARQYKVMEQLFTTARARIEQSARSNPDPPSSPLPKGGERGVERELTALIEELGKEALSENGDWILLHRDRPLDVPHGR